MSQLVACNDCGAVFTLADCPTMCCPICEHTTRKRQPVPKKGRCRKWWSFVDAQDGDRR